MNHRPPPRPPPAAPMPDRMSATAPASTLATPPAPDCDDVPLAHPLELVPFFRRWRPTLGRNLAYTVIWSSGMGLVLTALDLLLSREDVPLRSALPPMLLIANLIGALIHLTMLAANRLFRGWPRRLKGLRRLLFNGLVVSASVLAGIGLGNLLISGKDPLKLLARPGILAESLVIAAAIAVFMYMVRNAAERRVARAMEEARQKEVIASGARLLAEARLRALQAQIEPHFLYNTLANVVSLIGPRPAQAQHMLERFIDYLRASLDASRGEQATLGSEAGLAAAYLDVLKVRMGERLRYRIDIPDALRGCAIAPMLLQPVLENAIAHGLEPKVEGGEIALGAEERDGQLWITISDTGDGLASAAPRPAKRGGGVGLSNLRERLGSLYGGAARVELLENQPCGMTVRLMLPLPPITLTASPSSNPSAP